MQNVSFVVGSIIPTYMPVPTYYILPTCIHTFPPTRAAAEKDFGRLDHLVVEEPIWQPLIAGISAGGLAVERDTGRVLGEQT